jgi:hypothetical protein
MSAHDWQLSMWAFVMGVTVTAIFAQVLQATPRLAGARPTWLSYGATALACLVAIVFWGRLAWH